MKLYCFTYCLVITILMVIGCDNYYRPARPYTITETYSECDGGDAGSCKFMTRILDETPGH